MPSPTWWQNAICYQIYPRSFADSNGDGIGDLPGIISKLDYLKSLGVTALWISPFFPSPNFDWGYDVSDYTDVDPDYGSLADAEQLIAEAHQRGIRIILDLVLNHTSDQHPWFQAAKADPNSPYRDWYVWQDGVNGGPPNDWEAVFGGSAWAYDEASGQYYYHFFFPEQPDLNWRNPAVKETLFEAVRFWLDRGVDGFRLDAIPCMYEAEGFPNAEVDVPLEKIFLETNQGLFEAGGWELHDKKLRHQLNQPEVHTLMQELRTLIDSYDDRLLLGETEATEFYGTGDNELHSVFNFDIIARPSAPLLRNLLTARLARVPAGGWEANTVGNHDRSRSFSFYADGQHDRERAQMALAMVAYLQGTPVFYYGEEIGMRDFLPASVDAFKDGLGVWFYEALQRYGTEPEEAFEAAAKFMCRDRCRRPMLWENAPHGGFSPAEVTPWLTSNDDYAQGINVAEQEADPASMLNFFREMVQVRQNTPALQTGAQEILPDTGDILAFWRTTDSQRCLVALNMAAEANTLTLDESLTRLYSNAAQPSEPESARLSLQAYEVWVGESTV